MTREMIHFYRQRVKIGYRHFTAKNTRQTKIIATVCLSENVYDHMKVDTLVKCNFK